MGTTPSTSEEICQLEEQLLRPEIRRSRAALEKLLAEEFVEFATDGAGYTRPQIIAALQQGQIWQMVHRIAG
jgi:hypothetical protein